MSEGHRLSLGHLLGLSGRPEGNECRRVDDNMVLVCQARVAPSAQDADLPCLLVKTTLAIDLTDGDTKVIRRTTTQPVRSIKGQRPQIATSVS
ncbi:hypothetical protein [Micromonospora sp. NPDC047074]|uniref:hypothetical protein n=1 Tax=Micromonospora sp. NPDC047074 TaxID=3154339 RepID=UPI0033E02AF1